ncbi:MAG: tRNA threonylcarbamoyladenosine dehydratase [Eubacterium sp.]|nr:tRNA threonylcarbamoyladenosine dehydratase [Eubacterium sp.]
MREEFVRTALLLGDSAIEKLNKSKVLIFGIGGVGGYVCEGLARSGVGEFELVDKDTVSESNINRQIIATHTTVGKYKTEVMKERILDINPEAKISIKNTFFLPENADRFSFEDFDYVIDAVDTVTAKIEIIMRAKQANVPVISSMGAGNKLYPEHLKAADIYDTKICPLARVMRREMKKRRVESLKVVYSDEEAKTPVKEIIDEESKKMTPSSAIFVPATAGLIIAREVVKDLSGVEK